jgi:hypothetical protein
MIVCNFPEEIMPLIQFELVNSPTWVIARNVCAIHTISIHTKVTVHCIRKEVYIRKV